jgi:RimJ/RimL family protein N-acetyltransferase
LINQHLYDQYHYYRQTAERWRVLQASTKPGLFMEAFPELNTNRLKLRKITVEDIPFLVKYACNKKISDNILNIPFPYGEPDAVFRISYVYQGFKNKTHYVFAIIFKEREELIGEISLHLDRSRNQAQLAYWVGEPFWGKGMATEATEAILKFGFEQVNLNGIFAECRAENLASEKVLLNTGMKKKGTSGGVLLYRLTKPEHEEQTNAETKK